MPNKISLFAFAPVLSSALSSCKCFLDLVPDVLPVRGEGGAVWTGAGGGSSTATGLPVSAPRARGESSSIRTGAAGRLHSSSTRVVLRVEQPLLDTVTHSLTLWHG